MKESIKLLGIIHCYWCGEVGVVFRIECKNK